MYLCKLQKCVVSAKSESTTEQTKTEEKMKYKKIILGVALALACFSSQNANALTETKVKKTETQTAAPNVYWTDGYGRVSYTTNSIISPVVKIALKEGVLKSVWYLAFTMMPTRRRWN